MRDYEIVVMFYPDAEEEARKAALDRLTGIIKDNGEITEVDEWGNRKLAYEIEYYQEAYYVLVKFKAEVEAIAELDRIAKITDVVMRHMIVRMDD